jgi:hypothetical protein
MSVAGTVLAVVFSLRSRWRRRTLAMPSASHAGWS